MKLDKTNFKHRIRNVSKKITSFNLKNLIFNKPLLGKIIFTLTLIVIFRIAATITIPGVKVNSGFADSTSSFLGILNTIGGGGLSKLSIVALGISPFITASIIMQLFQSEAFPPIYRLAKSGPRGKRKINIATRGLTFVFAIMQAIVIITQFAIRSNLVSLASGYDKDVYKFFVLPLILVAGSMFSLFLGEQITNRGVGNGTSLLIFSGIVAMLPTQFKDAWYILGHKYDAQIHTIFGVDIALSREQAVINFAVYFISFWFLIFVITYIYKAQRQIPIQQTGAGMTTDNKKMSRLPMKLNPAGVMPIIFPIMLITIPSQIAQFWGADNSGRVWIEDNFSLTSPLGLGVLVFLIFFFSYGMALVTFNPAQIADNFKKQGTFIPGITPGDETEEYLTNVVSRVSVFSGFYLSVITLMKYVEQIIYHEVTNFAMGRVGQISFGGTTMLILVSVAIETMNQLEARDTSNKIVKKRKASLARTSANNKEEGLLW